MRRSEDRPLTLAATALALALALSGCSDDVVCPDIVPGATALHVSAHLTQRSDDPATGREESAFAEVVCSGDPLPVTLIAYINGRSLSDVGPADDMGLRATFEDDEVLWASGTPCSLGVTTDFGYATSTVLIPFAASPEAPLENEVGETLTISWSQAAGADYYRVTATLVAEPSAAFGSRDTLAIELNTRGTSATFTPDDLPVTGVLNGVVESVAGPFPEGGSEGNIEGDGWGFFSAIYSDAGSVFEVAIYDPLDRMRPSK